MNAKPIENSPAVNEADYTEYTKYTQIHERTVEDVPQVREQLKWKRLKLPENLFPEVSGDVSESVSIDDEGIEIKPFESHHESEFDEMAFQKTLGIPFKTYIGENGNHGYVIRSQSRAFDAPSVKIAYQLSESKPNLIDNYLIVAEAGTKLNVLIDYSALSSDTSGAEAFGALEGSNQHYGTTRVIAKKGSTVRVVKVQRLGVFDNHFDQNFSFVEEGANLELVDIQLGSRNKAIAYESHLKGRHSNVVLKSLYFGDENEQLDLSFTMRHFGARSESTILSKGALSGNSKKVFRGNLFFETGSVQSVGREKEVVVLLDARVKSDSIPALMCSEDDVIGEHAASIGQLDQEKIFYLMSRGLSLAEAKKLVIKASFEEVLMTLGESTFGGDDLKRSIEEALDRRLTDGNRP